MLLVKYVRTSLDKPLIRARKGFQDFASSEQQNKALWSINF